MVLPTILEKICGRKFEEIAERKRHISRAELQEHIRDLPPAREFVGAIESIVDSGNPAVISEIKKASPSKGVIREDFRPADIALSYQAAGAACLSVLTDKDFFQGSEAYLQQVREVCDLPVLRKDFTVDAYQVYESRHIGADAILLIVAALSEEKFFELYELAERVGLHVLIEVHNKEELEVALKTDAKIIGINNRNLHDFETSLDTTLNLLDSIGKDRTVITESGIHTADDVAMMRAHGVQGFLVGEAFMRFDDPGTGLKKLFF